MRRKENCSHEQFEVVEDNGQFAGQDAFSYGMKFIFTNLVCLVMIESPDCLWHVPFSFLYLV